MSKFLYRVSLLFVLTVLALFATHAHASNFLILGGPNPVSIPSALQQPLPSTFATGNNLNTYAWPTPDGTGLSVTTGQSSPPGLSAPQFPDVSFKPPAGATGVSPYGSGIAGLGPNQDVVINYPPATIDVSPPAGAALPGTPPAISAPYSPSVDLGQGPGSNATSMADALVGIKQGLLVGAAFVTDPRVKTLLSLAAAGITGYQLYQYLQSNNLNFDANGNIVSHPQACLSTYYYVPAVAAKDSSGNNIFQCPNGIGATIATGSLSACGTFIGPPTNLNVTCNTFSSVPPPPSPATDTAVDKAIQAAPAPVLADAANAYNKMGVPLPADLPMVPFTQPVDAQSPTVNGGTQTDSLGNTTQTQSRNNVQIQPGPTLSSPPVVTETNTQTKVVNGSPTTVTTVPTVPTVLPFSLPSSSGGGTPSVDLCLAHPEIWACANIVNLGDVASATLPASTVTLSAVQPVVVGPQAGVCPPPLQLSFMGKSMSLDLASSLCGFASAIKPFNIAAAGLAGIFLLMGAFRNNG